ncbi:Aspartate aminotransferase [Staphylococcus aureus]|uniref:Aspartate aminotransferase n=1 Tax=Staphylococcus aureus TaxID=1280 RepID=A0A380DV18_STAAU|nr:Aspartate aminotransferase [Staphylococcus aureus]
MNPLAQSLNEQLQQSNATAFAMLSDLGQNMFYPKAFYLNLLKQRVQHIMQL